MAEYHFTYEFALWKFPACSAIALLPAYKQRKGAGENGSSYEDRAARRAKLAMRRRLREKFTIQ